MEVDVLTEITSDGKSVRVTLVVKDNPLMALPPSEAFRAEVEQAVKAAINKVAA